MFNAPNGICVEEALDETLDSTSKIQRHNISLNYWLK